MPGHPFETGFDLTLRLERLIHPLNWKRPRLIFLTWHPMSEPKIVPLLLAGGAGSRLWPVSRDAMPKLFLPLVGERSTFQQALARVADPELFATPVVLTANEFRFFARAQAEELGIVCGSRTGIID